MKNPLDTTICIVTPDLLGPVRNGGIGTACTFLADELADAGYAVSILFTQCGTTAHAEEAWMARYRDRGIEVIVADSLQVTSRPPMRPHHPPLAMAHTVHNWLGERHFDVVFFMEWQGHGFYALHAKRAGLRFQDSVFITQIHSPSMWHALNNAEISSDPLTSLTYFMERKSVELADAVVSPSTYMLDWVRRYGFKPPEQAFVLPNLIGIGGESYTRQVSDVMPVQELVFFGRLEYRKGLAQFCDALDRLDGFGSKPIKVTFLGKFSRMGQEHSGTYIAQRAGKWPFPIEIHTRLDQAQALGYLQQPGRLAVMPSVADNSPYTVYECLVAGVPFLARDVGGVAELIDPRDQSACLFNDNPNILAERFAKVLRTGASVPRLAFDLGGNCRAWRALVENLLAVHKLPILLQAEKPKVSVCLTHYNRPAMLGQAVESLLAQDYANFEVILVDDGSTDSSAKAMLDNLEPVFAKRGWRIVHLPNSYLGKARNTAVRHAVGEFLLFIDDDNVARPNMISRFVQAAISSGADLITAVFDVFCDEQAPTASTQIVERFLPVGDIVSFSVVTNAIGDANALMRLDLFKQMGGFSEDYGLGHEDFELYLRAVLVGAKVSVVPEPLFWYRRNGASMLSSTHAAANRMRSFRPFMDILPAPLAELVVLAHGYAQSPINDSSSLSTEDHKRLQLGDPDALETVAVLARVLIDQGNTELADQLLNDLATSASPNTLSNTSAHSSTMLLLAAANRGSLEDLQSALSAFDHTNDGLLLAADACDLALVAVLRENPNVLIVSILAERLARGRPESISTQLDIALAMAKVAKADEALSFFERALKLADVDYLKQRTDVANAVSRNQFKSGLDHYYHHGRGEQCQWPERVNFERVCKQLINLIALDSDAVAHTRKLALMSVVRLFSGE